MHHIVQSTSLYGNLVSQHRHYDGNGFGMTFERKSSFEIFHAVSRSVSNVLHLLLLHPGVQQFQLTFFAVTATLMMGIPALGSEEEIANAAVSAATESTAAGKADLIGGPETFNAEGQTTWFLAEHSLFRSPHVGKK